MTPASVALVVVVLAIDVATGLQLLLGAIALVTVLAVGSRKRDKALIADLEKSEARLEKNLAGASERADEEHRLRRAEENRAFKLEGQLEELRQYAAPEAFKEIVSALGRLEGVMGTAIHEQGELIMQASALTAGQTATLEKIASDLALLAERLGAGGDRPAHLG